MDEMLSFLQIQFSCLNSLDKALETVIDSSIIMACNLELARRNTTLKQASSHLHEHDRNRLRRFGFMLQHLFSPIYFRCSGEETGERTFFKEAEGGSRAHLSIQEVVQRWQFFLY